MSHTVYILLCSDGSYYTGSTDDMQRRLFEHQEGFSPTAYTFRRRPVKLVWTEEVATLDDALLHEHQIKGWSHAKKRSFASLSFFSLSFLFLFLFFTKPLQSRGILWTDKQQGNLLNLNQGDTQ